MTIGIDGNEANVLHRVGIGEYSYELLMQFSKWQIANSKWKIYLKSHPNNALPRASANWEYDVFGPGKLWTQFALPAHLFLSRKRPDVFFTPSHYAPRFSPVPTAISIMDVSYLKFPELFRQSDLYQLQKWTAYSAKKAARIFTISQASKNDIIEAYNVDADRVVVTYPGIKPEATLKPRIYTMNTLKNTYHIDGDYILFVGTLQPRKNISRLIEAFSRMASNDDRIDSKLQLVIVGKKGWLYEEILEAPKKFGVEDKVKFLDFVSDEDLPLLYKHAQFYILPSLYEGFGLPVLEAMKHGCPVITSNVSSLPEAGGDAALYVDPTNVDDIAKKMNELLGNEKLRKELVAKGHEQVKKFSWEKTARETLEVLERMANSK